MEMRRKMLANAGIEEAMAVEKARRAAKAEAEAKAVEEARVAAEAGAKAKAEAETKAAEKAAAEKAAAEKAAANAAALLGLLQPLEALSLDADTLRRVTVAAVAYCDSQGAASFANLVERASRLIVHPQAAPSYRLGSSWP